MASIMVSKSLQLKNSGGFVSRLRLPQCCMRPCVARAVLGFKSDAAVAVPPKTAAQSTVRVRISTHFQAAFGEGLKVVGSHPVLGEWDVAAAPDMTWTDGHMWVSDLDVPDGADFEFKIVHLTYGGASWEPSANRPFKAAGVPEDAALDVVCSFGYPDLTAVQLTSARPVDDVSTITWDPTVGGLPADLTDDLSQQAAKAISKPAEPAPATSAASSAADSSGAATWDEVRKSAPEFKGKDAKKMRAVGTAAGTLAVGLAAGVVMSALAIDLTDAAVAGALLAAGATFLPAKDAKVAQKTAGKVLSTGLSATEAIARGFGLRSHAERRAQAEAAAVAEQLPDSGEEAAQEADRQLAASIAEAEALQSEGSSTGDANSVVLEESSSTPSAGVMLAAAALAATRVEEEVQKSMDEAAE